MKEPHMVAYRHNSALFSPEADKEISELQLLGKQFK